MATETQVSAYRDLWHPMQLKARRSSVLSCWSAHLRDNAGPMKRVLAITSGIQQASARLRIAELIEPLCERGIDLQMAAWGKNVIERRGLITSAANFDAVILQRRMLDPWNANSLRKHAKRIYFDVDDAVMYHAGRVGLISRWRTNARFRATCKILNHAVAGNDYLADILRSRGVSTSVLPTVVNPLHYHVKLHQPSDAVRLVWIGSSSTLPYVRDIFPALAAAAKQVPGLRLSIIADRTLEDAPVPVDFTPWSEETEAAALAAGDIGIAPTPTDRWTLGKCGFKIVQYMAAGLPVIASPVGANAAIVRDRESGYLPTTSDAWTSAIAELASDTTRRAVMGAVGRRDVWTIYNTARAADHWAEIILQKDEG